MTSPEELRKRWRKYAVEIRVVGAMPRLPSLWAHRVDKPKPVASCSCCGLPYVFCPVTGCGHCIALSVMEP